MTSNKTLLETTPSGETVGKDPRKLPKEQLEYFFDTTSPIAAIREKCLDCCHGAQEVGNMVATCVAVDCSLWPFRKGKNPFVKRQMTEEQREASKERLKKAREARK